MFSASHVYSAPLALSFLLTVSTMLAAQGLVTDRPDFTESAVVVPSGDLQLEAGFTFANLPASAGRDVSELTLGEALLRWGIVQNLEARVEVPNYIRLDQDVGSNDGLSDLSVGAKYQIGPLGGADPVDLALIGMMSLPTGDEFGSSEVVPEAILTSSREFGDGLSLGTQLMASLPLAADGRSFVWGATIVGAANLGPVGLFVEFAVEIPDEGTAPLLAHGGFVLPLNDRFQIDLHAGFGITDSAPDTFVGLGLALGT